MDKILEIQSQSSAKHKLIFCTKESHSTPSKYDLPPPLANEEKRGVVLPDGQINWSCPCLGGLPYGPCGFEFRQFFECIHKLKDEDENGPTSAQAQECFPKFALMKECFSKFPNLYPDDDDKEITQDMGIDNVTENNKKDDNEPI